MSFLTPLAGLIAAAIAVPALLLLYFLKLRRREVVVPSTLLWRRAVQDMQVNAPFQRLRRNLLLLLQLLLLAALAFALSRPTVSYSPPAGKSTVILIDRSASMAATDGQPAGSRLDEAKARAKSLVDTMSRGARALVIAFDDRAEIVQPFTTDTAQLKRAIDALQPTDRRTRMRLAYQLADAQGAMRAGAVQDAETIEPPDVFVFSDGRAIDTDDLSLRGTVRYVRIGTDTAANIGVVTLSARRNYERPNEVQVFTRLASSGPEPVTADVQLTVDGNVQRVARVTLAPDRWTPEQRREAESRGLVIQDSAEFVLDLPFAAVVRVEQMNKQGDALPADDAASVVIPAPRSLSVAFVTDGSNPYLLRLMDSLSLRDPKEVSPTEYQRLVASAGTSPAGTDRGGFDVYIFDGFRPQVLPPTGHFIYFGVLPPGLRLTAETRDGALLVDPAVFSVLDWKRDHPILRGLSLGQVFGQDTITLKPAPESEVLVESLQGPLVVLHREGRSIHLAVAINPMQSNWPLRVSYPVFLHNALQFIATSSDLSVRESYRPGDTPRIPRSALGSVTRLSVIPPDGSGLSRVSVDVPPLAADSGLGELVLPALERVGVYRIEPALEGFEQLAVNLLDANESNLLPAESAPGGVGETVVPGSSAPARTELWWWLVAAVAIPLLLVEWWVYTRRSHL